MFMAGADTEVMEGTNPAMARPTRQHMAVAMAMGEGSLVVVMVVAMAAAATVVTAAAEDTVPPSLPNHPSLQTLPSLLILPMLPLSLQLSLLHPRLRLPSHLRLPWIRLLRSFPVSQQLLCQKFLPLSR